MPDLSDCQFPPLEPPYAEALRDAVAFILERFEPFGILACGTIVHGTPDPESDLDLYVFHREPWRQRLQKRFRGVPAEIFVNPPAAAASYLERENARPQSAHMMATGFPVLETDPVVARLRERAREVLEAPPPLTDETRERYTGALLVEDAGDVVGRDADTAALLAAEAVTHAARLRFRQAGRFVPRHKDLLAELDGLDPELAREVRAFWAAPDAGERLVLARAIADRVFGAHRFFEWESSRDPVAPDAGA